MSESTIRKVLDWEEILEPWRPSSATGKVCHELKWTGSKTPREFMIDGETIARTQHGIVTSDQGNRIGHYARIHEFSGPNKDEHEMLIWSEH